MFPAVAEQVVPIPQVRDFKITTFGWQRTGTPNTSFEKWLHG
jgi:hypothetical protein